MGDESCYDQETEQSCRVELVVDLADRCIDSGNQTCCYPLEDDPLGTAAGVWCIINALVGFSGNLLTLLAIPFAKKNNRFGFRDSCDCTTWFIVNLAFSDLLYCSFNLPLYSVQYLSQEWPFGKELCYAFAAFRYINAFADWMSLAFIAVSRCAGLLWRKKAERFLTGSSGLAIIFLIYAYSIGIVSLALTGTVGTFGYNCRSGKCDFIQPDLDSVSPHVLYYSIGFSIPCLIILVCYVVIWWYIKHCNHYLKKASAGSRTVDQIQNREIKLTWTLLLISLCYLFCVGPITIVNIVDPTAAHVEIHLFMFCIYWMQYSLNFFIYALRSEQFRTAYVDFLARTWDNICRLCCCWEPEPSNPGTLVYVRTRRHTIHHPPVQRRKDGDDFDGVVRFRCPDCPDAAVEKRMSLQKLPRKSDACGGGDASLVGGSVTVKGTLPAEATNSSVVSCVWCERARRTHAEDFIQTISLRVESNGPQAEGSGGRWHRNRRRRRGNNKASLLDLEAALTSSFATASEGAWPRTAAARFEETRRPLDKDHRCRCRMQRSAGMDVLDETFGGEGRSYQRGVWRQELRLKIRRRSLTL